MAYSLLGEAGTRGESFHNVGVVVLENCETGFAMGSPGDVHG